jgi:hypothetical protein
MHGTRIQDKIYVWMDFQKLGRAVVILCEWIDRLHCTEDGRVNERRT